MRRIAFFGGSFDPPHRGHLAIARAAANQFALDQVLFAPVAQQPLKNEQVVTPFLHRYAMTVLATQADERFVPSLLDAPSEIGTQRDLNYTVDTLDRLRNSLAGSTDGTALFALVGADSWFDIAQWHQAARLLAMADWIVAARPGFSLARAERALPAEIAVEHHQDSAGSSMVMHHRQGASTRVYFLADVKEDISATELRAALDAGRADLDFLTPAVWDYIRKAGLYHAEL